MRKSVFVVLAAALLVACGGGGSSASSVEGDGSVVAAVHTNAAPLDACPNGGAQLDTGIDANNNGVLDSSEITNTQYICNGVTGPGGSTALVAITDESAGGNCPTGGKKISAGQDTSGDGVLDQEEITSTGFICNGTNGTNGANGTNGTNGISSLIVVTPELAGGSCPNGGSKVQAGRDLDGNGSLDQGEVASTSYVCTGPKGPGVTWTAAASNVTAQPNTGYIANNPSVRVKVTLPLLTGLAYGDVVRVSGAGDAGWSIAQNAGQSIQTAAVADVVYRWKSLGKSGAWQAIAASADGTRLVAASWGGQLAVSIDGGATWNARDSARNWHRVASSANGATLVAAVSNGYLYTSNDYGDTWVPRDQPRAWTAVASSADGTRLVAVANVGQIYVSTDSGRSWSARETTRAWRAVASSSDGTKLVAGTVSGQIYLSTDGGDNWTPTGPTGSWQAMTSSADGSKLVAADYGGQLAFSHDSGASWTAVTVASDGQYWSSLASSADGTRVVATAMSGRVYYSADSGRTWTAEEVPDLWVSACVSSDGMKLFAATGYDIYSRTPRTSTTPGTDGSISGEKYSAIELQYIGSGNFIVLSSTGELSVW